MSERVEPVDLGVTWDPNAPFARLLADDFGRAVLALNPHESHPDERCVVLVWSGTSSVSMAGPNDEAISGHRLYRAGLSNVLWAGEVYGSTLIRSLEMQNRVHPNHNPANWTGLRHHVVRTKECVVEVVARTVAVHRFGGSTLDAAVAALRD